MARKDNFTSDVYLEKLVELRNEHLPRKVCYILHWEFIKFSKYCTLKILYCLTLTEAEIALIRVKLKSDRFFWMYGVFYCSLLKEIELEKCNLLVQANELILN